MKHLLFGNFFNVFLNFYAVISFKRRDKSAICLSEHSYIIIYYILIVKGKLLKSNQFLQYVPI